ncbi:MAG: 2-oxoacid:acceptor oxidoreductase family protein [Planctomycetota bacterium]|jgi:2-oxoglutarate ferredoxin oxidoreductase subunit gamma
MNGNNLYEEVIIAGFGGQGIILLGKLLAQTAMKAGKEVTYMPSYGAEMRGGTANSKVIISEMPIANPVVNRPDSLIVMNKASVNKFAPLVKNPGLAVMNSSLIETKPALEKGIEILAVPADDIAVELGSPRSANMVMLGAYLAKRNVFKAEEAAECLADILAKRYHQMLEQMLEVNAQALRRGAEFAGRGSV